jgi:rSAM/selenodomain-associated transferase 1
MERDATAPDLLALAARSPQPAVMKPSARCAIAVMAKAPQPGRSKTRLTPRLSPEQAAGLSAAFLRDITENIAAAARTGQIDGFIAYAPAGAQALFDGHLALGTGLILADGTPAMPDDVTGFGRCLLQAINTLLTEGYNAAVVLNSDSPTLPAEYLIRTAALLAAPGDRAVLGPAEDGGYYLLGLKQAHAHMFAGIGWSSEHVAAQTRARAREIGLELVELPDWYDVDDAEALDRLIEELGRDEERTAAPATARWLAGAGLLAALAHPKHA